VLASDETGLRVAGKNGWLWVIHHADSAVFRAAPSRARRVLEDFLGEHRPDFWISDRYGAQKGFARSGHQFCLAHLIRDAQYAVDAGDTGFAPGFLALLRRACRIGGIRDRLSDAQLAACHRKLVRKLSELLQRPPTHPKGARLQTAMARSRGNLFLFVTNRALEPTNNGSERALRPAPPSARSPAGSARLAAPPSTPTSAPCWRPPDDAASRPSRPSPSPSRDAPLPLQAA
jgi:transposase